MINIDFIRSRLPVAEAYCQLAEEAAELAQAALKMHRILDGANPTPTMPVKAFKNLIEELADISLVVDVLMLNDDDIRLMIRNIKEEKLTRWVKRLKESEARE